jgi:hypothetical protein
MEYAPTGQDLNIAVSTTYVRPVISRFGGMVKQGTAVAIPPQHPGGLRKAAFQKRLEPTDGKGAPGMNAHRQRVAGWMVGYSGHRPGAREVTHTMACGGVPLFHNPDNNRQTLGQGAYLANRPTTSWQEIAPTLKPSDHGVVIGGVGVPGYMGYMPHGQGHPKERLSYGRRELRQDDPRTRSPYARAATLS